MGEGQKKKNILKNYVRAIWKKACNIFGIIVTVVAAILYIFADKVFDASGEIYKEAIYITIVGYIIVFFASIIAFSIFKIRFDKDELYEEVVRNFDENCQRVSGTVEDMNQINEEMMKLMGILTQDIEKEKNILTEIAIGQFVLDKRAVIQLEDSVGSYENVNKQQCKIYIQSSMFILEKGPLENTILWNLRKGVKYIYIIPAGNVYINDYYDMLYDWYKAFSQFLISEDDYGKMCEALDKERRYKRYWRHDYQQMFEEVGKIWRNKQLSEKSRTEKLNKYRKQCEEIFKSLIETHVDDENAFFITVAAYEVKRNNWEAIIKLPTQDMNKEYYAFQIPTENNAEMENFIHKFKSRYKACNYKTDDLSTLGGKLELDFSRIFN